MPEIHNYQIMLLGGPSVGKTSIQSRYCKNPFTEEYVPTREPTMKEKCSNRFLSFFRKSIDIVKIWDMPSMDDEKLFFNGANGRCFHELGSDMDAIVFIYDIGNRNSFERIQRPMRDIINITNENYRIKKPVFLLAGNKCDLVGIERQVIKKDGEQCAKDLNIPFMEISARSKINIKSAFAALLKAIKEKREERQRRNDEQIAETLVDEVDKPIKFNELKNNKWDLGYCDTNLHISGGGLVVRHVSRDMIIKTDSVLAHLQVPFASSHPADVEESIAFYYEVHILQNRIMDVGIGFCSPQYPINGTTGVGYATNSIGIWNKNGLLIGGTLKRFRGANYPLPFAPNDIIGIGIVYSKGSFKCFGTCNGNFLGIVKLPIDFKLLDLFPAISLSFPRTSIRANFGVEEWRFNPSRVIRCEEGPNVDEVDEFGI